MSKRKPYYLIIAALFFSTVISFFLPFLHLPKQKDVTGEGYKIDKVTAALNSKVVKDVSGISQKKSKFLSSSLGLFGRPSAV